MSIEGGRFTAVSRNPILNPNDECRYSLDGTQPEFDFFPSALLLADWLSATEFLFATSCISVVGFLAAFRILHEVSLRVPGLYQIPTCETYVHTEITVYVQCNLILVTGSTQFGGEANPGQVIDVELSRSVSHRAPAALLDACSCGQNLLPRHW